jgi:hypothetical protein
MMWEKREYSDMSLHIHTPKHIGRMPSYARAWPFHYAEFTTLTAAFPTQSDAAMSDVYPDE